MRNEQIYTKICEELGLKYDNAIANITLRKRIYLESRQIYFYIKKKYTRETLKEIGQFLNKDHSTVLHSLKNVKDLLEVDKNFKNLVEKIEVDLNLNKLENKKYLNVTLSVELYNSLPVTTRLKMLIHE